MLAGKQINDCSEKYSGSRGHINRMYIEKFKIIWIRIHIRVSQRKLAKK